MKKDKCSAFDKRCNTCGKIGHFSKTKACRQGIAKVEELVVQHERRTGQTDVGACAVIARAEVVQSDQWPKSKLIPHMIDVGGKLVEAQPPKHPTLKIRMKLDVQTYKDLKIPLQLRKSLMSRSGKVVQTPHVELLCDTGAQVDSIGRKKLKLLGLEEDQLLCPEVSLDCANKTAA